MQAQLRNDPLAAAGETTDTNRGYGQACRGLGDGVDFDADLPGETVSTQRRRKSLADLFGNVGPARVSARRHETARPFGLGHLTRECEEGAAFAGCQS
ncbi:MAG: hypothetical protein P8Y44_07240, partial [Acidobacteriota bacterium]